MSAPYCPRRRQVSPVNRPQRELLRNALLADLRRFGSLPVWERRHVVGLVFHELRRTELKEVGVDGCKTKKRKEQRFA